MIRKAIIVVLTLSQRRALHLPDKLPKRRYRPEACPGV